jgi:hypothetical protein
MKSSAEFNHSTSKSPERTLDIVQQSLSRKRPRFCDVGIRDRTIRGRALPQVDRKRLLNRRYRADILQPRRSISAEGIRERLREVRTQSLQETPATKARLWKDAKMHQRYDKVAAFSFGRRILG